MTYLGESDERLGNTRFGPQMKEESLELPADTYRLEEANLPAPMAASLAGKRVNIQVFDEEEGFTRQIDPEIESSGWIDPKGNFWNDYQPLRLLYTAPDGEVWRFPRSWFTRPETVDPPVDSGLTFREGVWNEEIHMPSEWDLQDINIGLIESRKSGGRVTVIKVHAVPGEPVKVYWKDISGKSWRIPANWRRRRVRLPSSEVLISQDTPPEVARSYAGKTVSVNYHPGSFCCLPDQYRFRDQEGNRWPVFVRDCLLLGYGDGEEYRA
jgi:hypothetical protein